MLTKERAKEVIQKQSRFPYWGNYSKFMTSDEIEHVEQLFRTDPNGSVSFASIVQRIARQEV